MWVYCTSPPHIISLSLYIYTLHNEDMSQTCQLKTLQYSVCVFSSHPFWTSSSLDVPAGVTQEEGHTGFLVHLPSAVRALIFVARRIQPFLSLVYKYLYQDEKRPYQYIYIERERETDQRCHCKTRDDEKMSRKSCCSNREKKKIRTIVYKKKEHQNAGTSRHLWVLAADPNEQLPHEARDSRRRRVDPRDQLRHHS